MIYINVGILLFAVAAIQYLAPQSVLWAILSTVLGLGYLIYGAIRTWKE